MVSSVISSQDDGCFESLIAIANSGSYQLRPPGIGVTFSGHKNCPLVG